MGAFGIGASVARSLEPGSASLEAAPLARVGGVLAHESSHTSNGEN